MPKGTTEKKNVLNGHAFGTLLKRVHLGGVINECVLTVQKGWGFVQAVDMSNSVFLSCKEQVKGIDDISIGFGNLSTLTTFLSDSNEVELSIDEKFLSLKRPGRGRIKVLLIEEGQVPTDVRGNKTDAAETIVGLTKVSAPLKEKVVADLVSYIMMVNCNSVFFRTKGDTVYIDNGVKEEQQFSMRIGKTQSGKTSEDLVVEVYSQYLLSVLRNLLWGEKEEPSILLGEKCPVVIMQNKTNLWALTPIME